ncbi:MAG: carboxylating nicotinate-nucleotide diphosphorylase [Bacteroidales bacterium]|jgi:nicotinate-nucleotide pyrophosphorylase (carboxylating)|nr:carboxylating nicotinate-nucleotide diphosphorylase [Bacteroidales bacterium]
MNIEEIIRKALEEDLGSGDHTSLATIPKDASGKSKLLVKEEGILAGVNIAREVYHQLDPALTFETLIPDGSVIKPGDVAFYISGSSRSILSGERLALNFMQRMSGIATATYRLVKLTEGTGVKILDTRKTTPLLRELEKSAVRLGGGENHRFGLFDMIMIKDNHVDFAGGIREAIRAVEEYQALKLKGTRLKIEIEVRDFKELLEVMETGGVDRVMLDNFSPGDLARAVKLINGRFETEASGGITISNIRAYAETGVDYISVGALTHHIKSLDMSLKAVI